MSRSVAQGGRSIRVGVAALAVVVMGALGSLSWTIGAAGSGPHEAAARVAPAVAPPMAVQGTPSITRTTAGSETPHRVTIPVLLIPGWLDTGRDLAALRIRLLASGWRDDEILMLTFRETTGSNRDHADEIAMAVDSLMARTGADAVDVVAHSMGGLATRWYLLHHPDAPVRRVAFLASPHRGTQSAHLAWGGGRSEMMPDSPFLDTLNVAAPVPDGVEVITVRTVIDTHIIPGESATLPGVEDHELCCPTHAGLLDDAEVFEIVRDFLERKAADGGEPVGRGVSEVG